MMETAVVNPVTELRLAVDMTLAAHAARILVVSGAVFLERDTAILMPECITTVAGVKLIVSASKRSCMHQFAGLGFSLAVGVEDVVDAATA